MSLNQYSQFAQKMIGLNRQICRLNNVRTFFLSVSNTSPNKKKKLSKEPITGTTLRKKHPYEMASVADNVRVMIVRNKGLKDKHTVYCSIRVGVGFEDDPPRVEGLAHLLEHVICQTHRDLYLNDNRFGFHCETMNFETKISFAVPFVDNISTWTEVMFSDTGITKEIVRQERERVDNEYHEKRTGVFVIWAAEILKKQLNITLGTLGDGNNETFGPYNDDVLMEKLKDFRKYYRQRPLNVCVYSAQKIKMDDVKHSLGINGSTKTEQRNEAEELNWMERLKGVEAQNVVVLQSDNDYIQFTIIYPFHKKLNLDEEDTFTLVGDLITKKLEGQLGHVLFEKKMATRCEGYVFKSIYSFGVIITLTADGLKHIRQVERMVHDYFQFLHDKWQKIDMQPLIALNWRTFDKQSEIDYADSIARCLGRVSDTFDEEDLFRPLTSAADVQKLIMEQILNNKSIRHIIAARNVDEVYKTLVQIAGLAAKGVIKTETKMKKKNYYLETALFAPPSNYDSFELPDLQPKFDIKETTSEPLPVFIDDPMDEAYLALCEHYLVLKTANLTMSHNLLKEGNYGIHRTVDGSITVEFVRKYSKQYLEKYHPETEIDFDYYKQSLMEKYSLIMADSQMLASSLLMTNLLNSTSNIKRLPIPLQYKVLKKVDFEEYKELFQYLSLMEKTQYKPNGTREPFHDKYIIKSINADESITVTLAFLHQPKDTDEKVRQGLVYCLYDLLTRDKLVPNLYTCDCDYAKFGCTEGLLLTLRSVEKKSNQTGEVILTKLEGEMDDLVRKSNVPDRDKVTTLWNEMRKRRTTIQIVGYANAGPSGPFQTHFDQWFGDHEHEKTFYLLSNMIMNKL